jgi:hypothetical protein
MQDIRRLEDETREELDRVSYPVYIIDNNSVPLVLGEMSDSVTLKEINEADLLAPSVVLGESRRCESKFLWIMRGFFEYWFTFFSLFVCFPFF